MPSYLESSGRNTLSSFTPTATGSSGEFWRLVSVKYLLWLLLGQISLQLQDWTVLFLPYVLGSPFDFAMHLSRLDPEPVSI